MLQQGSSTIMALYREEKSNCSELLFLVLELKAQVPHEMWIRSHIMKKLCFPFFHNKFIKLYKLNLIRVGNLTNKYFHILHILTVYTRTHQNTFA